MPSALSIVLVLILTAATGALILFANRRLGGALLQLVARVFVCAMVICLVALVVLQMSISVDVRSWASLLAIDLVALAVVLGVAVTRIRRRTDTGGCENLDTQLLDTATS